MAYTQKEIENLSTAIESLKKYRRADLRDEKDKDLLETLYTDLLPNNHILNKSIKENTTFLIGRKGTGKSTIFLRIEQELRKTEKYLPCYLDVKTIYESSQTDFLNGDYLTNYLPQKTAEKYLIERGFLQSILKQIVVEIDKKYDTWWEKVKSAFSETKAQETKNKILSLINKIESNDALQRIELPILQNLASKKKTIDENSSTQNQSSGGSIKVGVDKDGPKIDASIADENKTSDGVKYSTEIEESFSAVLLQVFEIKNFIEELKVILKIINVRHIFILLDDFSEIDDRAIKNFVDVLLAPLNNWSDEFIKFKIAAYPGRMYYGKIDPGKIDTINLDFYNLYSEFDRNKMEIGAIDFTKRLIEKRISFYVKQNPSYFFDTSRTSMDSYYELLFQCSMNVPRIIGYILSYCYQSKIIYGKTITKQDIESAAEKYYDDKIEPFFHKTTYSLLSINEKIDILQLKELLSRFVEKMVDIKKRIATGEYDGEVYQPTSPFSSHFHFISDLEKFIRTLELNFFITKYAELVDKDGLASSIYCLNYGLTQKRNLLWGKPKGNIYSKYFQQRPFNFTAIIKEFLSTTKTIHCVNEECNKVFSQEHLPMLEFSGFECNKCKSEVIIEAISKGISEELAKIEKDNLLNHSDVEIVSFLTKQQTALTAREISEEIDISKYSVAQRAKLLDENKGLIKRNKNKTTPLTYELTESAKNIYK